MTQQRKTKALSSVEIKTKDDDSSLKEGEFIVYPAVFNVVDSHGDKIVKGAFAEDIAEWEASGQTEPILYGHDFADPENNVGGVIKAEEDDHGLRVHGYFDLESDRAKHVYRLVQQKRISDLSFAYNVLEEKIVKDDNGALDHFELQKLKTFEFSFVPIGANRETSVEQVKSEARRVNSAAGRVQSAKSTGEALNAWAQVMESVAKGVKALADEVDPDTAEKLRSIAESGSPDETPEASASGEQNHEAHTPTGDTDFEDPLGKEQGDDVDVSAELMEFESLLKFHALRAESEDSDENVR